MIKRFVLLLLVHILTACPLVIAKQDEPAQSTQGLEIDQNITKSKSTHEQKNEQKLNRNRSKKCIKIKKEIKKTDYKRTIKQTELEYSENRLEQKKKKLEALSSGSKGEKE